MARKTSCIAGALPMISAVGSASWDNFSVVSSNFLTTTSSCSSFFLCFNRSATRSAAALPLILLRARVTVLLVFTMRAKSNELPPDLLFPQLPKIVPLEFPNDI